MTRPWLCVAMPVHNGASLLGDTLQSVATQNTRGIEFRIYDSSPEPDCGPIVDSYRDRLAIEYRHMPDVKPWTVKTNLAVAHTSAPHVAMLHQDDLWLDGHVEALRLSLANSPETVMSVGPSRFVDRLGRDCGQWSTPCRNGAHPGDEFGRRLIVQNFLAIPSPVVARDAWLRVGGLEEGLWYTADWDLYLKLCRAGDIVVRDSATTAFRIHGGSLTMTGSRDEIALRNQHQKVLDRHGDAFGLGSDKALGRRADASVAVNCALASLAGRKVSAVGTLVRQISCLGPVEFLRYLRESRLFDRVIPRLRARLAGDL